MGDKAMMTTVQVDVETRELLARLAEMDLRSATQELKYLVMELARQRGLVEAEAASEWKLSNSTMSAKLLDEAVQG